MNSSPLLRCAVVLGFLGAVVPVAQAAPVGQAGLETPNSRHESHLMPDMRTTDLNGNGATDLADLSMFAATFFACGGVPGPVCVPGDYNCDGIAGLADLSTFAANYFAGGVFMIKCPPAAAPAVGPAQGP